MKLVREKKIRNVLHHKKIEIGNMRENIFKSKEGKFSKFA